MSASQTMSHDAVKALGRSLACSPGEQHWEESSKLHGGGHSSGGATSHKGTNPGAGRGGKQTHDLPGPKKGGTPGKEA
jgi:hypothetical protein